MTTSSNFHADGISREDEGARHRVHSFRIQFSEPPYFEDDPWIEGQYGQLSQEQADPGSELRGHDFVNSTQRRIDEESQNPQLFPSFITGAQSSSASFSNQTLDVDWADEVRPSLIYSEGSWTSCPVNARDKAERNSTIDGFDPGMGSGPDDTSSFWDLLALPACVPPAAQADAHIPDQGLPLSLPSFSYSNLGQPTIATPTIPETELQPLKQSSQAISKPSYLCHIPECQKSFPRLCDLNKHKKSHARSFPCPIANCTARPFSISKDLQRHMDNLHGNGILLTCSFPGCGSTFKRRDNWRRHFENKHAALITTGDDEEIPA